MEIYLPRSEIIRRAMARLGFTTNAAQAPLIAAEFQELARSAALEVYERFDWVNTQEETRVTVGIDQLVIDYPPNTTAANILAIGYWNGTAYVPLLERILPISEGDEPLVAIGEPGSISGRGYPRYFQKKNQIRISPRADQEYEVKIVHTLSPDLATDATVSIIDAELIILKMIQNKRADMGDDGLSALAGGRFEERLANISRRQSSANAVKRSSSYRARANARLVYSSDMQPNSGQWPSVVPGT